MNKRVVRRPGAGGYSASDQFLSNDRRFENQDSAYSDAMRPRAGEEFLARN
jgi:hypothetical protein